RLLLTPRHVLGLVRAHDPELLLDRGNTWVGIWQRFQEQVLEDVEDHPFSHGVLEKHLQRVVLVVRRQEPDYPVARERVELQRPKDLREQPEMRDLLACLPDVKIRRL